MDLIDFNSTIQKVEDMEAILHAKAMVKDILADVCPSHGYEHALNVLNHYDNAMKYKPYSMKPADIVAGRLASLLHDVDDHKLFPNNRENENAKKILEECGRGVDVNAVIRMIELVSASKNGDTIPSDALAAPWLLYPRHCDRLEAIGEVGIARCLQYNKTIGSAMWAEKTLWPESEDDLWSRCATPEQYARYHACGKSVSVIDHFYDKLLHVCPRNTGNRYLDEEGQRRLQPMVDFVMNAAKSRDTQKI